MSLHKDEAKSGSVGKRVAVLSVIIMMGLLLTACIGIGDNYCACYVEGCNKCIVSESYKYCNVHCFPGDIDPPNCQVSGCDEVAWNTFYFSKLGNYCYKHGVAREIELGIRCKGTGNGDVCENAPKKDGLCVGCYAKLYKEPGMCFDVTCREPVYKNGLCEKHFENKEKGICQYIGCKLKASDKRGYEYGFCPKHRAWRESYMEQFPGIIADLSEELLREEVEFKKSALKEEIEYRQESIKKAEDDLKNIDKIGEGWRDREKEEFRERVEKNMEENKEVLAELQEELNNFDIEKEMQKLQKQGTK